MNEPRSLATGGVGRRELLLGGTAAILGTAAAGRARAQEARAAWTWERFLAESPARVAELTKSGRAEDHDAYVYELAALVRRVERVPGVDLRAFGGLDPRVLFGMLHRGDTPFFVVEWRLEPGAALPAHCHPGTSVCTLTLEGEAELRHFEVEAGAPAFDSGSTDTFRLHETRRQRLRAGSVSTLTPSRDNLHWFRSASGAHGIDITTMHAGNGRFSFARFDPDRPLDAALGLYEAAWVGQEPPR